LIGCSPVDRPAPGYSARVTETGAPGFVQLLGLTVDENPEPGTGRILLEADEQHLNGAGGVHGGVLATLVDSAMGQAVRSVSRDGQGLATSQLTVTYLNPAEPGQLVATAQVRKRGKSLVVCDAEIEQDGEPVVHAVATFALLES
jgi:uncharacterized protein (TIGR00369 family)